MQPAQFNQGLNGAWIKYNLLCSVKAEKMPHGQDLLGVFEPICSDFKLVLKNFTALLLGVMHHMEIESKAD